MTADEARATVTEARGALSEAMRALSLPGPDWEGAVDALKRAEKACGLLKVRCMVEGWETEL